MRRREERENLRRLRQGDREAYETAICRHYKAVYRFLAYMTADAGLAEELTQETFASAWSNIDRFEGRASLGTWLHKIAYRKFVDVKRRLQRETALTDGLKGHSGDVPRTGAADPLHRLAADEDKRLLYEAMDRLESSQHIVVVLHYIQGLSFRETAKVLDEPVGTVKWKINRALKTLRGYLAGRVET